MSSPLYSFIVREAAQRPLTIARYMEWVLQHPEYGYYRQRDPLGTAGDFVTAPEISQMFGELIGLWCVDCWWQMGQPTEFVLLELGPGRGTLMADALRAARKTPAFMQAMRLHLFESNEVFRQQQGERLMAYAPVWVTSVSEVPAVPTLIIANEFFDALPIRQIVHRTEGANGWMERCIGAENEKLGWVEIPADVTLLQQIAPEHLAMPLEAVAEIAPLAQAIMAQCAAHIVHHNGALLTFDYGYELATGEPSFQAVAQHQQVDPLTAPGLADLTAHVDFIALERAATAQGAQIWQVQEQGALLERLGLSQRAAHLAAQAAEPQAIAAAYHRLTADEAMGKLFKVLCVTKDTTIVPAGWVME